MTGPRITVRRVRKCRWPKACGLCGSPIPAGGREALIQPLDGTGPCLWCHLGCVLDARGPSAAASPGAHARNPAGQPPTATGQAVPAHPPGTMKR